MKNELLTFSVIPSVVKANKTCEITIVSHDPCFSFYDDVTYEVAFIPMEESDVPMNEEMTLLGFDENRVYQKVRSENGVLKLSYFFLGEQEWKIHIRTKEYGAHTNPLYKEYVPHWNPLIAVPEQGKYLSVYSVEEDLYCRRPKKADLHVHTYLSDGKENPEVVAAEYRAKGYDVVALTDHNVYGAAKAAIEKFDFQTDYKLFMGEEVHNGYVGYFHVVNICGDYSINDIYINDPARVEREVAKLEKTVEVPNGLDKKEYLHRVWLKEAIKKSGGYSIYAHPYWRVANHYHTESKMTNAILKNKLCDAYELLGGVGPSDNNLQTALYYEMRAQGVDLPVVGSTDSHSVFDEKTHFNAASTIAFVKDDFVGAIDEGYSVAVEHLAGETARAYGHFRLVKYALFLLHNYYPVHNRLCQTAGESIQGYLKGEVEKTVVEALEKRVTDFDKKFFG